MKKIRKLFWSAHQKIFGKDFFPEGYNVLYPDVKASSFSEWEHYVKHGKGEGRGMGYPTKQQFDSELYLKLNPDVAAAGMDAWVHYVRFGLLEGREKQTKQMKTRCSLSNTDAESNKPKPLGSSYSNDPKKWEIPHFSIIMPTYNRAGLIKKSVDAVLSQTYAHFELLITDDGSTDNTEEVIKKAYSRELNEGTIRYIKCPHGGVCSTRNAALKAANNPWIAYVDTDNYVTEDFLKLFAEAIKENPGKNCFYSKFQKIEDGKIVGRSFSYEQLLEGNYIDIGVFVHHISVYRKCGGFDEKLERLVDWDLILRYTYKNEPVFIDKVSLLYSNDPHRTDRISVSASYRNAFDRVRLKHRTKSVTTCITTYNQENDIAQAIESALAQKGNIKQRIIIYDDCSTDGTEKVARSYAEKYPNAITYIRNEKNLGVSGNLERVFREAKGDYMAILEGDDYWLDEMRLHKMTTYLDCNPDCSMCFNKLYVYSVANKRFRFLKRQAGLPEKLDGWDILNTVYNNPIVNLTACVYRVSAIPSMPECIYDGVVSELSVALSMLRSGKVAFWNEPISVYRQHSKGVYSGLDKRKSIEYRIRSRQTMHDVAEDCYKPRLLETIDKLKKELAAL